MKKIIIVLCSVLLFARCVPPQRLLGNSQMITLGTDSLMFEIADKNRDVLFLRMKDTLTDSRARHLVISIRDTQADTVVKNEHISRSDMAVEDTHYIYLTDIGSGTYSATIHQFYGNGITSWAIPLKTITIVRQ